MKRTYVSRILRIIEDNLLEIDLIVGNDEKVIVLDNNYVLDRESKEGNQVIEWKYDRRQPKLELRGNNIAGAEENLMKMFKEGDFIVFSHLAQRGLTNKM